MSGYTSGGALGTLHLLLLSASEHTQPASIRASPELYVAVMKEEEEVHRTKRVKASLAPEFNEQEFWSVQVTFHTTLVYVRGGFAGACRRCS